MAIATITDTTSTSVLNKLWRKIQGPVATGIQYKSEEWALLDDFEVEESEWSAREVTRPIELNEGAGVASIPESGYKAVPSSPNLEEATYTLVNFNKRFEASLLAKAGDRGSANQVAKQLKHQAKMAVFDVARHYSDYFYGLSTAVLATTDTDISGASATLTLTAAYGQTGITNAAFIADKFRVGDRIAVLSGGSLVTNGIGTITAVSASTPSISVTFIGSVSVTTNGLQIVKANSMENATIAGTDYNRGLVGLLDGMLTSSVHSLSHANWVPSYSDITGGRFNGIRLRRMADEIANEGGGKLDLMIVAQGVQRDVIAAERALVRFDDPFGMEIDGDVKAKGRRIFSSRRVPPGYLFGGDKSSLKRWALKPKPDGSMGWADGMERVDQSVVVFSMDYFVGLNWENRKNWAYASGLTEQ
jgi:hypothetical protein